MIASLRGLHRGSFVVLALALPLGLTWALAGRTVLPIGIATAPASELDPAADLPRSPGTHLGAREGELVVTGMDNEPANGPTSVYVLAPASAPSGDVVLYASSVEPALKSDLPAGARWLGPQLRRGAPATYRVELAAGEAFVVAYDLSIATVVGYYRIDAARKH